MPKKNKKTSKKTKKSRKKTKITRKKPSIVNVDLVNEKIPAVVEKAGYSKRKLNILLGYLTFFIVAFVLSSILYSASATTFNENLFFMLALIFGAFSITLLIVLLIYVFMRILSRK